MTLTDVDTTYEPYSQDPGYIAANAALIEALDLAGVTRVADLACGTGLLSGVLHGLKPEVAIAGIDLDPVQIGIARRTFPGTVVDDLASLRAKAAAGEGAAWFNAASATTCRSRTPRSTSSCRAIRSI